MWELARVGKCIVIVEPAPPADPLGKRISELYSRAKYEAGAFEEYQPIDYWRKLLAMVKADVLMQQFTFTRLAPRFAVEETVGLILDAMEVEQMPQAYLEELRELARRPESQLSPLSRFVLVALGAGEPVRATAGTLFREETAQELAEPRRAAPGRCGRRRSRRSADGPLRLLRHRPGAMPPGPGRPRPRRTLRPCKGRNFRPSCRRPERPRRRHPSCRPPSTRQVPRPRPQPPVAPAPFLPAAANAAAAADAGAASTRGRLWSARSAGTPSTAAARRPPELPR